MLIFPISPLVMFVPRLTTALAVILLVPTVSAQDNDEPREPGIGYIPTIALPGGNTDDNGLLALIGLVFSIARGEAPFGERLAEIVALLEGPLDGDTLALQTASGAGLKWSLHHVDEWDGHFGEIRSLVLIHAENGGVLFGPSTEAVVELERRNTDDLGALRAAIIGAYRLRDEDTTATWEDGVVGLEPNFVQSKDRMPPSVRRVYEEHIARHRAGAAVVERWIADH